jgi:hypothetical protein
MGLSFLDIVIEYPFLPIYCLTVALAIWRYPRYFDTPLRYFPILLMYTLVNEILGVLIKQYDQISIFFNDFFQNYNWLIYNIYTIIFYLYFYYVLRSYLKKKRHKEIIKAGASVFVLASVINPFFQSFFFETQVLSYIVGGLVLIIAAVLYFNQLKAKFQTWFLQNHLLSWIAVGLLIFYTGFIPVLVVRHYNALNNLNDPPFIRVLLISLIFSMYVCFSIGFVKMRRRQAT